MINPRFIAKFRSSDVPVETPLYENNVADSQRSTIVGKKGYLPKASLPTINFLCMFVCIV
jgi:hypothetical protein